jgi:DNA-binding XRE family transcriptional regulator
MTRPKLSALKILRESWALRQFDIAILAGVSPSTVFAAERHGLISKTSKAKIPKVLGIEPSVLFGDGPGELR